MLGNEAAARGLYEAGVNVVSSYPGTPSTEITEFAAKYDEIYCEWAPNEKVATEVAFGASLRALNSFENIAVSLADGAFRGFDPYRFPEVYDTITKADVEAFLRDNIVEERRAMSLLVPMSASAAREDDR